MHQEWRGQSAAPISLKRKSPGYLDPILQKKTKRRTVRTAGVLMTFFFLDAGATLSLWE
jgi:hypothetical protein